MANSSRKSESSSLPEILAPVGNDDMAQAAFAAGADAVYLAGLSFGARAYAQNFTEEGLEETIRKAHQKGAKVYVTVNTALKEEEVDRALESLVDLYRMGADAIIIQDPGLIYLASRLLPDLPLHGSTQLSVNALSGARLAQERGLTRLVLGREISREEAGLIKEGTDLEIEVFVHGSLCVSQSGQCLLSSFAGGRSGNRGRCAQPCRKTYLLKRGDGRIIGPADTYLSPRDLMTLDQVKRFRDMGLDSLKIEGRMKKPEYVYAAVSSYRAALEDRPVDPDRLALMTNRPFTKGFFFEDFGVNLAYRKGDPTGLFLGKIEHRKGRPVLQSRRALYKGDQIRVLGRRGYFPLTLTEDHAKGSVMDFSAYPDLVKGSPVYEIYTARVRESLEEDLKEENPAKKPLTIKLSFKMGEAMKAEFSSLGVTVQVEGDRVDPAQKRPLTRESLQKSLKKLGNTPFFLDRLEVDLEGEGFLPMGAINALRRKGVEALTDKMTRPDRPDLDLSAFKTKLEVLKKDRDQVKATLPVEEPVQVFFWTNRDPFSYPPSDLEGMDVVLTEDPALVSSWGEAGKAVFLVLPELAESRHFEAFLEEEEGALKLAKGVYLPTINEWGRVRELDPDKEIILGAGLQVFNRWAAHALEKEGEDLLGQADFRKRLRAVIPSTELMTEEYEDLLTYPLPWLLPVYGRMTGMVLRHCPASAIKGCRDDRHCRTCPFNHDLYLEDDFGSRELVRTGRMTRLLVPTLIDLRLDPGRVQGLSSRLLVIDRGEGEGGTVAREWKMGALSRPKKAARKGEVVFSRDMGHYDQLME